MMRLINYEEYKSKLLAVRDSIPLTVPAASYELMREKPYAHGMAMRAGIHKALRCLEQCQSVTGMSDKHGWWMPVHESEISGWDPELAGRDPVGSYECSCCGKEAVFDCNDNWILSPYCPNCGAEMNGGVENA